MTDLTAKGIASAANAMAKEYLDTIAGLGFSPNDTANLTSAAMVQVLASQLGPMGTVERLRDLADLLEKELLETPVGD